MNDEAKREESVSITIDGGGGKENEKTFSTNLT